MIKHLTYCAAAVALVGTAALAGHADPLPKPGVSAMVEVIELNRSSDPYVDDISIPVGKSVTLRFDTAIAEASVGNPETADIVPLTERSLYILGKDKGSTNVTLFGANKRVLGVIDIDVAYDTVSLKKRLHEVLPGEDIQVRMNGDTIMLSGKVSSSGVSSRATELANTFAPGKVLNMLEIGASQQVMLSVRFAEVERSAAKELGISTSALFDDAGTDFLASNFTTPNDLASDSFAVLRDVINIGDATLEVILDTLEQKGIASILAEPTLIAISGEQATFLAGGEFPVPVASEADDGGTRIQIEFKEFGVRLAFTPTVMGDTISLIVTPEVSELDPQNGIELNDIVIPGLRTRRTSTTVELKNGQSFAIAGLIQKNFLDDLNQLPGFGNTPILGSLMRSARYRRDETELAIIITPYIVEPSDSNTLMTPADNLLLPHEFELFFLGKTEGGENNSGLISSIAQLNQLASTSSATTTRDGATVGYILE